MRSRHVGMVLAILAVLVLIGYSVDSFAWGRGGGYGMGPGSGNCPRGGFGGPGMAGNLTEEEIATVQKERNAFFESTRELRERRFNKEQELGGSLPSRPRTPRRRPSCRVGFPTWRASWIRSAWSTG